MSNITLDSYLFFRGDCKEAMEFYKSIFGGELTLMSYDDAPDGVGEDMKDKIMHAFLSGGDIRLMASDTSMASEKAAKVSLCLGGSDEQRLRDIFERLSEGGEVKYPLKKEFWGDIHGNLIDKYNIDWMVNISMQK